LITFFAGKQIESTRWGLRWALVTLLGGILAYNYLTLGMFGVESVLENGISGMIVFVLFGEFFGWMAGWIWLRRETI
jgi:hypothetical protein